jgi:hypothetical protein
MERKSVLAARPGQLVPYMSEHDLAIRRKFRDASGKDRSAALMISDSGVWDCAMKRVVTPGPVSVPWTEFYQEQERMGGLRVVDVAKDAPRGTGASERGKRAGSDV